MKRVEIKRLTHMEASIEKLMKVIRVCYLFCSGVHLCAWQNNLFVLENLSLLLGVNI